MVMVASKRMGCRDVLFYKNNMCRFVRFFHSSLVLSFLLFNSMMFLILAFDFLVL